MKKRRLKSYVIPTTITVLLVALFVTSALYMRKDNSLNENKENLEYVSNSILENNIPVMNTSTKIINPYTDASVMIGKYFYDYKGTAENQEKSIIFHDNTYMQNSGIDFTSEQQFDVVAILNGTVTNVKEDELLGKIVEIKHGNDYISVYQSLAETTVKKGDSVTQGQVIGKSGTNELDKEMGNHLHFEFYANGQVVDPTLYLNKEISSSNDN